MLFKLIRGRDVSKWKTDFADEYFIIPHNPSTGYPIKDGEMSTTYKNAYQYFLKFKDNLKKRTIKPFLSKKNINNYPFYVLDNIGKRSFSKYKVAWKYISGKISGKGEFSVAVIEPVKDEKIIQEIAIPNEKLIMIPFDEKNEAHFVASILNSSFSQLIVMSYTIETAISTHVMEHIKIPHFNVKDKTHIDLSELSKKAHQLAKQNKQEELKQVEDQIDKTVAELYGISDVELDEIKKTLRMLREGESEETEEDDEEQQTLPTGNEIAVKIEPLNIIEGKEYNLTIDFLNNSKNQIIINSFKVSLDGKEILMVDKSKKINDH